MNRPKKKKQINQAFSKKINQYIKDWEGKGYEGGIPDEAPKRLEQLKKVPSYRQVCIAILKNDYSLKSLGLTPIKSRVYNILKREELMAAGRITQLEIE